MSKQHPNVKALREYNRWRRGKNTNQPNPTEVGALIDWAINVCEAADNLINAKCKHADVGYRRLEDAVKSSCNHDSARL